MKSKPPPVEVSLIRIQAAARTPGAALYSSYIGEYHLRWKSDITGTGAVLIRTLDWQRFFEVTRCALREFAAARKKPFAIAGDNITANYKAYDSAEWRGVNG